VVAFGGGRYDQWRSTYLYGEKEAASLEHNKERRICRRKSRRACSIEYAAIPATGSKDRWVTGAAKANRLVVGEQGVMDGRHGSRNGNRIVLDRKAGGRKQCVASWMGQRASKIVFGEKVRGKQQGIAAKVVVDENASGRMGRTSRDICVGAFVADWS